MIPSLLTHWFITHQPELQVFHWGCWPARLHGFCRMKRDSPISMTRQGPVPPPPAFVSTDESGLMFSTWLSALQRLPKMNLLQRTLWDSTKLARLGEARAGCPRLTRLGSVAEHWRSETRRRRQMKSKTIVAVKKNQEKIQGSNRRYRSVLGAEWMLDPRKVPIRRAVCPGRGRVQGA